MAALLASGCMPDRKAAPKDGQDDPTTAELSELNRMLDQPNGAACTSLTVMDEIEMIALEDVDARYRDWNPEEISSFVFGYQSTMSGVTLAGYEQGIKRTSCTAKYEASVGSESWSNSIEYSIQPALDGPRPVILVTDMGPIRAVNVHLQDTFEREVVRPRQLANEMADREAQIAANELEIPQLAARARTGCAPQPTDESFQRCLIAQFRMLRALTPATTPTSNATSPAEPNTAQASQLSGPRLPGPVPGSAATAIFNQVYSKVDCDLPGSEMLRVQMDVTLSNDGQITQGPTLVSPQSSSEYQSAAEAALRAMRETAPFDVPTGFQGGKFRPTFNLERACRNR